MDIRLNTINDVYDFVLICNKYKESEIDVKQGRQIIDGRSILGLFSLNLLKPLKVTIESENEISERNFFFDIKKWKENF